MSRPLFALMIVAALAPAVHADTTPSVDDILAKHYEAQGGLDKIRKVQTMRLTGKMTMGPGMESTFMLEKKRPNMQRMEFTFSGMTGISAYDGKQGWQVMPFMGKKDPEPIAAEDQKEVEEQADFDGSLVDWKAKGATVEVVDKEPVEGADAWKLKITKKSGRIEYDYLDADTYLLVQQEEKITQRGTEIDGVSTFSDYKDVDGLMFPFSMTSGAAGTDHKQTLTFDKIELGIALEDTLFHMPAVPAHADSTASKK